MGPPPPPLTTETVELTALKSRVQHLEAQLCTLRSNQTMTGAVLCLLAFADFVTVVTATGFK